MNSYKHIWTSYFFQFQFRIEPSNFRIFLGPQSPKSSLATAENFLHLPGKHDDFMMTSWQNRFKSHIFFGTFWKILKSGDFLGIGEIQRSSFSTQLDGGNQIDQRPQSRFLLNVTLHKVVIFQRFHQDFVLSGAHGRVEAKRMTCGDLWLSISADHLIETPSREPISWLIETSYFSIWFQDISRHSHSINSLFTKNVGWMSLHQHDITWPASWVATPMTSPSRAFTRSRTIWDQPPAWQPRSITTDLLRGSAGGTGFLVVSKSGPEIGYPSHHPF